MCFYKGVSVMSRLPDPVLNKLTVEWPDESEYKTREENFFNILGQAVRKAKLNNKKEDDDKEK